MPATAVFRTDANTHIGLGHVMRCLALAQAWMDTGGKAVFLLADEVPAVRMRLRTEGIEVRYLSSPSGAIADATETRAVLTAVNAEWLVLDGYHFEVPFITQLRSDGCKMMLFDDHGKRPQYEVEIVLNPNVFGRRELYPQESNAEFLLGLKYALLRKEFWNLAKRGAIAPNNVSKLLIAMGGSDPANVTCLLLKALDLVEANELEITVIVGGANPNLEAIKEAAKTARHPVQLLPNVTDMSVVLGHAEAAITAPGGTCAELALMGIPTFLVTIADNHVLTGEEFAAKEMAVSAGWYKQYTPESLADRIQGFLMDAELRRKVAKKALSQVDGQGAKRVVETMLRHTKAGGA